MSEDILILEKKINAFNNLYDKYKKQNSVDTIELKECLCDILTWFEICLKTSTNFNSLENEKVSGIKYANNVKSIVFLYLNILFKHMHYFLLTDYIHQLVFIHQISIFSGILYP